MVGGRGGEEAGRGGCTRDCWGLMLGSQVRESIVDPKPLLLGDWTFFCAFLISRWMDGWMVDHTRSSFLLTDDHNAINGLSFSENIGCTFLQYSLFVADQVPRRLDIDGFHPASLESRKRTDEGCCLNLTFPPSLDLSNTKANVSPISDQSG